MSAKLQANKSLCDVACCEDFDFWKKKKNRVELWNL